MVIFTTEYTATFFNRHNISLFVYCLLVTDILVVRSGWESGALLPDNPSLFQPLNIRYHEKYKK